MKSLVSLNLLVIIIALIACDKENIEEENEHIIDIFVLGSSFTNQYVYYLEMMVDSVGDSIFVGEASIGNAGLKVHIEESNTLSKLAGYEWDYVMIQESGYMACVPEEEAREVTFPCVKLLVDTIRICQPDARIGLFMTQAYERGHEDRCPYDPGVCTYAGMQNRIIENNIKLAKEFELELAPVGYYWQKFSNEHPDIRLFSHDRSHGSPAGRFLTSSIIYSTIFRSEIPLSISTRLLSKTTSELIRDYLNDYLFDDAAWDSLYHAVN